MFCLCSRQNPDSAVHKKEKENILPYNEMSFPAPQQPSCSQSPAFKDLLVFHSPKPILT